MRGELTVRLPLAEEAGLEAVAVSVAARLEDAAMALAGDRLHRIHDGSGTLTVGKDGFELAGDAALTASREPCSGARVSGRTRSAGSRLRRSSTRRRATASGSGSTGSPGRSPWSWTRRRPAAGRWRRPSSSTRRRRRCRCPALHWEKPPGAPAAARATLVLDDDGSIGEVARFEIAADGLAAAGSAAPTGDGGWTARLERLRAGRTDVSGVVRTGNGAATALLDGASLDLRAAVRGDGADPPPPFVLSAKVSELALDDSLSLADATVHASHDGRV